MQKSDCPFEYKKYDLGWVKRGKSLERFFGPSLWDITPLAARKRKNDWEFND